MVAFELGDCGWHVGTRSHDAAFSVDDGTRRRIYFSWNILSTFFTSVCDTLYFRVGTIANPDDASTSCLPCEHVDYNI